MKKKLFSELPTLTGDGITLRPLHIGDARAEGVDRGQ